MRVELRVLVVLGLAVGAWLLLAPTPSADGSGCGIPVLSLDEEDTVGRAEDCPTRNSTRVTQASWALFPVLFVAAVGYAVRHREREAPGPAPRGHWA